MSRFFQIIFLILGVAILAPIILSVILYYSVPSDGCPDRGVYYTKCVIDSGELMGLAIGSTKEETFYSIVKSRTSFEADFTPDIEAPRASDIEFRYVNSRDLIFFLKRDEWNLGYRGYFSSIGFGYTISLRFNNNRLNEIVWIRQFGL